MSLRKNINKLLIRAVIGSSILGVGAIAAIHKDKKGKTLLEKIGKFLADGLKEMKKAMKPKK